MYVCMYASVLNRITVQNTMEGQHFLPLHPPAKLKLLFLIAIAQYFYPHALDIRYYGYVHITVECIRKTVPLLIDTYNSFIKS